jgi:DNA-binding NtrC family response regulator
VELLDATNCLAGRYPRHPSELHISESETEGDFAAQARVLVVDDERLLADTTAAILRRAGFAVKTAYEGFGALEAMASFHPDYLLTDIMMPGMNGVELAIAITKIHPATKILLFSGQAGISEILEESKAMGFEFPLLAKPVHPTKLIEELKGLKNG